MQATTSSEIRIECLVPAAPEQVYRAFTHSTALTEWLCNYATAVARLDGRFYVAWSQGYYAAGWYTLLQENQEVAFTWLGRGEPGQSQVRVTLSAQEGGTQVTLVHNGFGQGDAWEKHCDEIERGWQRGLENLVSVVGSGPDLRITRRPMMGVVFSDFNADVARNIGVPVSEGTRLEGTLEGLGARKAGLQRNDVIVELNGQPIKSFDDFGPLLTKRQAGDTVKVGFYRGMEKKEVEMVLAPRPLPEIPRTPAGLAEALQKIHDGQLAELSTMLSGVSEEEANFHPGERQWSAKEVLTHLILDERGSNDFIYDLAVGFERVTDVFGEALPERVQVMALSYPTLADALAEYQRVTQETVRVVAALGDKLVARKGSYWRMAYGLLTGSFHLNDHLEQIALALKAART